MNPPAFSSQQTIEQLFHELAGLGHFTEKEQQEIFANIEDAISANLVGKLIDRLPENERKFLERKQEAFDKSEDFLSYLSQSLSPETFRTSATEAIQEVIQKFFKKVFTKDLGYSYP